MRRQNWLKRSLLVLLVGALVADYFAQWAVWGVDRRFTTTHNPYYSWAMYSVDGSRLSKRDGILRLRFNSLGGYTIEPNQKSDYFNVNSQGFRGKEIDRTAGKKLVVILGGSTAFGTGLNSDEETLSRQLEKILPITVLNAAAIGYTSEQELNLFTSKIVQLEPDLVIALNGVNDYAKSFVQPGQTELELKLKDLRNLNHQYYLVRVFHNLTASFFPVIRQLVFGQLYPGRTSAVDEQSLEKVADDYANNEVILNKLITALNKKFLCIIQPEHNLILLDNGLSISNSPLKESAIGFSRFSSRAEQKMKENHIMVVNWATKEANFKPEQFMDAVHLDANGNRVMAERIATIINDSHLLD